MAHDARLYGAFQDPLAEGADVVTGSTHKTFFRPQRGVIVSNMDENNGLDKLWSEIKTAPCPAPPVTSPRHAAGAARRFLRNELFQGENSKNRSSPMPRLCQSPERARGHCRRGFPPTASPKPTRVLIRVRPIRHQRRNRPAAGNKIQLSLTIQALPDDGSFVGFQRYPDGCSGNDPFRHERKRFAQLADYIGGLHHEKPAKSATRSRNFRQQFQEMQYCLPIEKAAP